MAFIGIELEAGIAGFCGISVLAALCLFGAIPFLWDSYNFGAVCPSKTYAVSGR
jgi:hypothetical protein